MRLFTGIALDLGLDKRDEVIGQNEIRANHGLLGFTVMTVI